MIGRFVSQGFKAFLAAAIELVSGISVSPSENFSDNLQRNCAERSLANSPGKSIASRESSVTINTTELSDFLMDLSTSQRSVL